jgi:hypothetical protein
MKRLALTDNFLEEGLEEDHSCWVADSRRRRTVASPNTEDSMTFFLNSVTVFHFFFS